MTAVDARDRLESMSRWRNQNFNRSPRLSAERELEVGRLLSQCVPHLQIRAYLKQKWGCSEETVRRAINEVYYRWGQAAQPEKDSRREQMRQALMDFYTAARKHGAYAPAVTALDRLCRIDGLYAPEKLEVAEGQSQDIASSNPDAIRARIVELYERFKHAGGAAVGNAQPRLTPVSASEEPVGAGGEGPPPGEEVH